MVAVTTLLGALLIEGALLLGYHIWCKRDWDRKEADLLNRIQAGSLSEYHAVTTGKKEPVKGRSHSQKVLEEQGVEQA